MTRRSFFNWCLAGLFAIGAPHASAQNRETQIIYWPLVSDGSDYRRVAYPHEAGTLVAKAGSQVVLDIREAEVTYWPITQEYLTDVSRSSPSVEGVFEIVDDQGKIDEIAQVPFLLWYSEGVGASPALLIVGEQVSTLY